MLRTLAPVGLLLVAVAPWMTGGRDAAALLISAFALALCWFLGGRQTSKNFDTPLFTALALWLGWGVLSLLWTANRYQTELWLLYSILAVLAGILAARLPKEDKHRLISGYIWVAVATSLFGTYLYFTGSYDRLTSAFYWANPAAAYLLAAGLLATRRAI